jgi:hypothetical protein
LKFPYSYERQLIAYPQYVVAFTPLTHKPFLPYTPPIRKRFLINDLSIINQYQYRLTLVFESDGSDKAIGGPDLTKLELFFGDGKVVDANMSHSHIEIVSSGQLHIQV